MRSARSVLIEGADKARQKKNWTMLMNNFFAFSPALRTVRMWCVHFYLFKFSCVHLNFYLFDFWLEKRSRSFLDLPPDQSKWFIFANVLESRTFAHAHVTQIVRRQDHGRARACVCVCGRVHRFCLIYIFFTGILSGFRWIIFVYGLLSIDVRANIKSLKNNNENDLMPRMLRGLVCVCACVRVFDDKDASTSIKNRWHWSPDFYWTITTTRTTANSSNGNSFGK